MTRRTFYRKLAALDRKWTVVGEEIRTTDDYHRDCPVTAVAVAETGDGYHVNDYAEGAEAIGLPRPDANAIVYAADNDGHPTTRRALLRACGLEA